MLNLSPTHTPQPQPLDMPMSGEKAMSYEFQGLLVVGTLFALSGRVPEGNKVLTARWTYK